MEPSGARCRGALEVLSVVGFASQLAWGYMACLSPALMPPGASEQGVGIEYAYYTSQLTVLLVGIAAVSALRRWHPGVPPWAIAAASVALTVASGAVAALVSQGHPGAVAMAGVVACGVVYGLAGALAGVAWGARVTLAGARATGLVLASFALAYVLYLALGRTPLGVQRTVTLALPLVSGAAWTHDSWRRHGLTRDVWPTRTQTGFADGLGETSAGEVAASVLPWRWLVLVALAAFVGNLTSSFVMGEGYGGAATIYVVGVAVALALVGVSVAAGLLVRAGRTQAARRVRPVEVLFATAAGLAALGMLLAMLQASESVRAPDGSQLDQLQLLGVAVVVGAGIALQVVVYLITVDATRQMGISPLLSFGVGQATVAGVVVAGNVCGRALSRALAGVPGPFGGVSWLSVVCALGVFCLFCLMETLTWSRLRDTEAISEKDEPATQDDSAAQDGFSVQNDSAVQDETSAWEARVRTMSEELGLTPRESQVLEWLLRGHTMASIAERLYVTTGTVKTHVLHIYRKADVSGRQELIERFEQLRPDTRA